MEEIKYNVKQLALIDALFRIIEIYKPEKHVENDITFYNISLCDVILCNPSFNIKTKQTAEKLIKPLFDNNVILKSSYKKEEGDSYIAMNIERISQ